jgi:nucleotide-binding universal stress UspA family protein
MERKRNIALCVEDTDAAESAAIWAVQGLYREGDVFHLIYVVKSLKPPMEVYHGMPGTAYSFSQPGQHKEQAVIAAAKRAIEHRYLPVLKTKMVPYELHLYAERDDATSDRVAEVLLRSIEERDAALVVLAAHNKPVAKEDKFQGNVGSVTAAIIKRCKRPLAIIHHPE